MTLEVVSIDNPQATARLQLKIVRPPVVLVHGLWGSESDWDVFQPLLSDSRFAIVRASYSYPVGGIITNTTPAYSTSVLKKARTSSLGLAFNAPFVLGQIELALAAYRLTKNVAVVQTDVVAHSMGGIIVRTAQRLPAFATTNTYHIGFINKLITIGTPHLGSPLATELLTADNSCIRRVLAIRKISLESGIVGSMPVTGGVGDLRGDGWGGAMSNALVALGTSNTITTPTAFIVGLAATANLSGLNCSMCAAGFLRSLCTTSPLANSLTPQLWPSVLGQASDGVVPETSQLANLTGTAVTGVVHSSGLYDLNFIGPSELEQPSTVPLQSIRLLNASSQGFDFHALP